MASEFNFCSVSLAPFYTCVISAALYTWKVKNHKSRFNWIKIELFSVLSVFFFSSYFLFRNHFCPFFCLSFTRLSSLPSQQHFISLDSRGSLNGESQKDFKRLPYVRERNSTIWIFILIKSSKSISCFQEHITVVSSNTYSTSVVLVLYLLAQT